MVNSNDNKDFDTDEPEPIEEREFSARSISDWVKRTIATGASAEPLISLLSQAEKTRREITNLLAREMRGFLSSIEIQDVLRKILSNATLEINAKIRLIPSNDGGLQVKVVHEPAKTKSPKKKKAAKKQTGKKSGNS